MPEEPDLAAGLHPRGSGNGRSITSSPADGGSAAPLLGASVGEAEGAPSSPPPPVGLKPPRTEAQRATSRKNGAKGRGPTTKEGKYRSRLNAVRHALYARTLGPTPDTTYEHVEFKTILKQLRAEYHPQTIEAHLLAEKVARHFIYVRRVDRYRDVILKPGTSQDRSVPAHADDIPGLLEAVNAVFARARRLLAAADAARDAVMRAVFEPRKPCDPEDSEAAKKKYRLPQALLTSRSKSIQFPEQEPAARAAEDRAVTDAAAHDPPPEFAASVAIQLAADVAMVARGWESDHRFWSDPKLPGDERTKLMGDRTRYEQIKRAVALYKMVEPRRRRFVHDRYVAELLTGEREVPVEALHAWGMLLEQVRRRYEQRCDEFDDEQHQQRLTEQEEVRNLFTDELASRAIDRMLRCDTQAIRNLERLLVMLKQACEDPNTSSRKPGASRGARQYKS
jgi:hypothetical protein